MFRIHPSAQIDPTARFDVDEGFIGAGAVVRPGVVVEGRRIEIGRDAFLGKGAWIGGGSCRDPDALLTAGDFLHMGADSHINIARPVTLGHEVGFGIESKIFTHGAWLSAWEGFPASFAPVSIGDRVWLPNAWINPGVKLGSDIVVAARALINRDLPSGCFAAGSPAQVIKRDVFPRALGDAEKATLFATIIGEAARIAGCDRAYERAADGAFRLAGGAMFDLDRRVLDGPGDAFTETLRNQLRRYGIRFRFELVDGVYRPWQAG